MYGLHASDVPVLERRQVPSHWEKYRSDSKKKIFNPHPREEHQVQAEAAAKRWR